MPFFLNCSLINKNRINMGTLETKNILQSSLRLVVIGWLIDQHKYFFRVKRSVQKALLWKNKLNIRALNDGYVVVFGVRNNSRIWNYKLKRCDWRSEWMLLFWCAATRTDDIFFLYQFGNEQQYWRKRISVYVCVTHI